MVANLVWPWYYYLIWKSEEIFFEFLIDCFTIFYFLFWSICWHHTILILNYELIFYRMIFLFCILPRMSHCLSILYLWIINYLFTDILYLKFFRFWWKFQIFHLFLINRTIDIWSFVDKVLFSRFVFIKCSLSCCYPKSLIIISFVYKIFQMDDSYNSLIYKTSFLNSMVPIGQFPDPTRDLLLTESPCVTFFLSLS